MAKKCLLALVIVLFLSACSAPIEQPTQVVKISESQEGTVAEPTQAIMQTSAPIASKDAFKACLVTDTGGINDRMFNASAWKGIKDAQVQLGIEGKYLESKSQSDYEPNLKAFVNEKCDLIIAVGFLQADALKVVAMENPDQNFAIVDFEYASPISNVRSLMFDIKEAAFLAGYLAAGMTETGNIGTFGGMNFPAVTDYMDGVYYGIQYYNSEHNSQTTLIGWDPTNPSTGLFLGNFTSLEDARAFGTNLMEEGADMLFPCAGPANFGAAAAAKERGGISLIGGDTDQYITAPEYGDLYLTSILKNIDVAVFSTIQDLVNGSPFEGGVYIGTLANGGVGISPFYNFENKIPESMKIRIEEIKQDIIAGKIPIQE